MAKLRIGFLLQKQHCPKWQYDILQAIQLDPSLEISLLVINGEKSKVRKTARSGRGQLLTNKIIRPFRKVFSLINPLGYGIPHLYHLLDEQAHRTLEEDLWLKFPVPKFKQADMLEMEAKRKGYSHYFSPEQIQQIESYKLDVIIRFGFSIIRGDIHHTAKHGIWSFHHGDNRFYRGGPPGVWELIKGQPQIAVTLQQLNDKLDCGQTIARSVHRVEPYSVYRNKLLMYSACGELLLQKLRETQKMGFDHIKNSPIFNEAIPASEILKSPRNYQFLPLLFNNAKTYFKLRWPRNKKVQWYLAVNKGQTSFDNFPNSSIIFPPLDRFYADPFLIKENGTHYVIFEEFIYTNSDAHISIGTLKDGQLIDIKPIIEEDFHLSYPFVFKEGNDWFLIPESRHNQSVRLYKCIQFPYQWELQKTLLNEVELLDPTLFKKDDTYYLLANRYNQKRNTSNECLVIYYADSLDGEWLEHPLNPITINIANSRPAGKIFQHNEKLIMPTQNSAKSYGYSVNFNQIDISPTHFCMEKIAELLPHWHKGNLGTHTWNQLDDLTVIDGNRYIAQ